MQNPAWFESIFWHNCKHWFHFVPISMYSISKRYQIYCIRLRVSQGHVKQNPDFHLLNLNFIWHKNKERTQQFYIRLWSNQTFYAQHLSVMVTLLFNISVTSFEIEKLTTFNSLSTKAGGAIHYCDSSECKSINVSFEILQRLY